MAWSTLKSLGLVICLMAGVMGKASEVILGEADREWLANNPRIEFSYDPVWVPFSYRDERGNFAGLDADVLRVLSRRLGVEFVPVEAKDWGDAYARALAGEVSMLTSTARTPEREEAFIFTRPYVAFQVAILTRATEPDFDDLSLLIGRKVAAVAGYAPTEALRRDFPEIEQVECRSMAEALRMVAAGKADAAITNLVNATYVIREEGIMGLKAAGVAPYMFQLRIAVRRDHAELQRALDAAIASLDGAERQALLAPYVEMETGAIVSWQRAARWFVAVCAVGGLLIGAGAWRNRVLRSELAERRRLQREVEESHARLERLHEEKGGLMRMAAHDLRNPLTGMLLSIEMLRLTAKPGEALVLERMVEQINQMMRLIANLLDVQALEEGTRRLILERLVWEETVVECMAAMEAGARRKDIVMELTTDQPGLAVQVDRSALRQICDNLISNAVKYSPRGSRVQVRITQVGGEGGKVRFLVADQGPGVRADEMDQLFKKYTFLSARPTAGEPSTGLGLSIVRELVHRMGGRVWCESTPGAGARFMVEFPAS